MIDRRVFIERFLLPLKDCTLRAYCKSMSVAKLDVAKPIERAELNFGPPFAIPLESGTRITYCPTAVLGGASDPSHTKEGTLYRNFRPAFAVKFKEGTTIAYDPTCRQL